MNFGFEALELTEYHCTHMYLDTLSEDEKDMIIEIIDIFFRDNKQNKFYTEFDKREVFGTKKCFIGG
ncbi:hypothetical protein HC864_04955 [Candidatus Gracilibacteria bacterium]|nr:hypothetical protein [Candidatus Gracilibacteria bacterium]